MSNTPEVPEQDRSGRVADATDLNWVDRFCPAFSRPYLRLSRADRPAGTWLLLIPCWWGMFLALWSTGQEIDAGVIWLFFAFAFGAFLMRGAGCTWNDITDRDIDVQVARTRSRPIPSGQVTPKKAAVWMLVQVAFAFLILLTFNPFSILLGIAALVPVIIYPFAKRFTWWPQVFLGLAFNWGALIGWSAITGRLATAPLILYLAGISWTLFYDTIYACQDKEDDALIGVKSTARLFGAATKKWLLAFLILTLVLATGSVGFAFNDSINIVSLITVIMGLWAFGWHMTWQLRRLDPENADTCLVLFRSNREAGLIFAVSLVFAIVANFAVSIA